MILPPDVIRKLIQASCLGLIGPGPLQDALLERIEQIEQYGFDLQHDLGHHPATLALAAQSYLATAIDQLHGKHHHPQQPCPEWPWEREAWRPGTARDNIVKALAIGLAVLDRIDVQPPL